VERRSRIQNLGLPCKSLFFLMCETLIEEILFPIVACCVCVFLGVIPKFRVMVSYSKNKRIML